MAKDTKFMVEYSTKDLMDELKNIKKSIAEIHEMASNTNGKVKFHTKALFGLGSFSLAILGFLISHLLASI